jgi:hypothetical protein
MNRVTRVLLPRSGRMMMPEANDARTVQVAQPKSNGLLISAFIILLLIIIAGVVVGVYFYVKKENEGKPGNWTDAQIDEKVNALLDKAPRELTESMAVADLREIVKCGVKDLSLKYAYDDACFKSNSCANLIDLPLMMEKCIGGQKGRWSAAAKDLWVKGVETQMGMSHPLALCVVDALSKSYSLSELMKMGEASIELYSNIEKSCLGGTPLTFGGTEVTFNVTAGGAG